MIDMFKQAIIYVNSAKNVILVRDRNRRNKWLALESRNNKELRILDELFYVCCDELNDIKSIEALQLMMNLLKSVLVEKLSLTKQQIDGLWEHFIVSLSAFFKGKMAKLQWET